jgi:N-methylhydantoinase A
LVVIFDADRRKRKELETRDLLSIRTLEAVADGFVPKLSELIHGTTLVINSIIERKGARTALITTKGFRDVLEIGREMR